MINHQRRSFLSLSIAAITFATLLILSSGEETLLADSSIVVTTMADELNQDGDCSLREAIQAVNLGQTVDGCTIAGSAPHAILLQAGVYSLTLAGPFEDENATGDLDVLGMAVLAGHDTLTTTIDGARLDRVFHIHADAYLTATRIIIQNGQAPTVTSPSQVGGNHGGGILNTGVVSLAHVSVIDNRAGHGQRGAEDIGSTDVFSRPGGSGGGIYNRGQLTIADAIISHNQAGNGSGGTDGQPGGDGGAVYNAGTISIEQSTIGNNVAGRGGAEFIFNGRGGSGGGLMNTGVMSIFGSVIVENQTGPGNGILGSSAPGDGGGLANFGALTIEESTILGNVTAGGSYGSGGSTSGGAGGGIFNRGTLTVSISTISQNNTGGGARGSLRAGPGGGGLGGGLYTDGHALVVRSSVDRNQTGSGGWGTTGARGGHGGGVYNAGDGILTVAVSTISGNQTGNGGDAFPGPSPRFGGSGGVGGGILSHGTMTLTQATLSNNRTGIGGTYMGDGGTDGIDGTGGGVAVYPESSTSLHNTIVISNSARSWIDVADCDIRSDNFRSLGYNLTGIDTGCTIEDEGDRTTAHPRLGPLTSTGGLTWVHPLLIGSPAIDAGDTEDCSVTDQRGIERPLDGDGDGLAQCDIGSYEADAGSNFHLPLVFN